MDSAFLDSEISYFQENKIEVKLSRPNPRFQIVDIIIRKCILLRVVLQDDYPSLWPLSVRLYSFETNLLKPSRQQGIEEFLKNASLELNTIVDQNQGKCVLIQLYEKAKSLVESQKEETLGITFEILEAKSKNQNFKIDANSTGTKSASVLVSDSDSDQEVQTKKNNSKKSLLKRNKDQEQNEDSTKQSKFKGSDFIFQRFKWDKNIDKDQVVIGYLDRFLGIKDINFNDYKGVHEDLEGVPLHRIRYFKINDTIVWDRDRKIDLITATGDISKFFRNNKIHSESIVEDLTEVTFAISVENLKQSISDKKVFKYSTGNWNQIDSNKITSDILGGFNLMTYNIMSRNNFKKSILSKMNFKKSQAEVLNRNENVKDELGLKNLDKIDRLPKILELIQTSAPDFVLLQECEQYEETRLKEHNFIRKTYFFAYDEMSACAILSKHKPKFFKILNLYENSSKNALIAKFEVRTNSLRKKEEIVLVNFHLTSNKSNDFSTKRKVQLETLKQYLVDRVDEFDLQADYTFLCGDFNFDDKLDVTENRFVEELFIKNGFKDMVPNCVTFDPSSNFSASITAFKTNPRRLDRILLKTNKSNFILKNSNLANTAPFKIVLEPENPILYEPYLNLSSYFTQNKILIDKEEGNRTSYLQNEFYLHPSDHYALECSFEFKNSLTQANLVHKSSLAIIAPEFVSKEFIQQVRKEFDPQITRWPPHINILYPFFEDIDLDLDLDCEGSVISDLFSCFSKIKPFECDFNELGVFDKNNVIYLEPSENAQKEMRNIYKELKILFEDTKNSKWNRPELSPHMTIAQPVDKKRAGQNWAKSTLEKIKNNFKDILCRKPLESFTVDCVYWITRTDSTPFKIKYAFPLGSRYPSTILGLNPSKEDSDIIKFLIDKNAIALKEFNQNFENSYELIKDSILNSVKSDLSLVPIGSYNFGIKCNDIDFGIIKSNTFSEENFSGKLAYELAQNTKLFHIVRNIDDAFVPIIELCLKSEQEIYCQGADIQIHSLDEAYLSKLDSFYFDNFNIMSSLGKGIEEYFKFYPLSGIFENKNLKKHIRYYKDFQVVISFVKYWAKCRNLYGKAFGFLGGISWSLMVAFFLKQKFESFTHELCLDNSSLRFEKLIKEFFKFYSNWDFSEPISIINLEHVINLTNKYQHKTPIMILQTVYPYHNTSKNVTDKIRKLIQEELNRCSRLLNIENNLESACLPISRNDMPSKNICFKINFNNLNDLGHLFTLIKAKVQGLVTSLQKLNQKIFFRPFTEFLEADGQAEMNYKHRKLYYIGIYEIISNFDARETQIIMDLCNNMISSINSLTHAYDFKILAEIN